MNEYGLLLARLVLGVPFVIWGTLKLRGGAAQLVPGLKALGLPDATFLASLVGLCELLGGVFVMIGYPARTASVLLGLWCLATGYDAHLSDRNSLLLHVVAAGGYFALAAAGAGNISLFAGQPTGLFALLP